MDIFCKLQQKNVEFQKNQGTSHNTMSEISNINFFCHDTIKRSGLKVSLQNLGFKRGFQNSRLTELLDLKSFF